MPPAIPRQNAAHARGRADRARAPQRLRRRRLGGARGGGAHLAGTVSVRALAALLALSSALSIPLPRASAQEAATAPPPVRTREQRRAVPDYDGLPDPGPTPEEVAIWIPRILLSPLHLVSEFLLRRPLGAFLTWAERENLHTILVNFFTWEERRAGLVPVAFFDFGLMPSFGLYFFWNDLGAPGHQLRIRVGFGGVDWLRATIRDRILLSPSVELSFRAEGWRWPDRVYQGVGAERASTRARFRQDELTGRVELAVRPWRRSSLNLGVGVGAYRFDANGYDVNHTDRSLAGAMADGQFAALPEGFDGYVAYRQRIRATLDSREEPPAPGHGVRVDVFAEQGLDLLAPLGRRWIRWGGTLSGYLDAGSERVFSLHVRTLFVDPLGPSAVPFPELVHLGTEILELPGFFRGSLVDRSAVVATLRYRWPVWVWLDATLFVGTGNTFGEHLVDFRADRLRLSWGFGLQSTGDRDSAFRVTLAFGTRTLEGGADVESVRFGIGGDLGF